MPPASTHRSCHVKIHLGPICIHHFLEAPNPGSRSQPGSLHSSAEDAPRCNCHLPKERNTVQRRDTAESWHRQQGTARWAGPHLFNQKSKTESACNFWQPELNFCSLSQQVIDGSTVFFLSQHLSMPCLPTVLTALSSAAKLHSYSDLQWSPLN